MALLACTSAPAAEPKPPRLKVSANKRFRVAEDGRPGQGEMTSEEITMPRDLLPAVALPAVRSGPGSAGRPGKACPVKVARNSLDELCQASTAVSRGQLFIRTDRHVYCIGAK